MHPSLQPSLHTSFFVSVLFNTVYFVLTSISHRQLETSQYKPVLALIDTLTELKRLDDMILIKVHLLESRVYSQNLESC